MILLVFAQEGPTDLVSGVIQHHAVQFEEICREIKYNTEMGDLSEGNI
jgi:hypothetical protein